MADLGDSVTLNGVTYRTEAAHEAALQEAVALLKNGHAPAGGSPDGVVQVLARLDGLRKEIEALHANPSTLALPVSLVQRLERIEQALTVRRASAEAAPDVLKTLSARLDLIRNALEQLARSTSEGSTPLPEALGRRLSEIETRLHQCVTDVGIEVHGHAAGTLADLQELLQPMALRLERLEQQQALLLELLDTATAPPPPPARVPPQITRPTPAPEVPADPTPFLMPRPQRPVRLLDRFLADPTLTTAGLAQQLQLRSPQTITNRLKEEAQQRGPALERALRQRLLQNRSRTFRSAAAGNAPAPNTAAGTSK